MEPRVDYIVNRKYIPLTRIYEKNLLTVYSTGECKFYMVSDESLMPSDCYIVLD